MQFSPTRQVTTAFAFAYPLVAHLAVARSSAKLTVAAWLAISLVIAGCWWLARSSVHVLPLYLHAPDAMPEEAALVYARRLTLAWTVLFVGLALSNLLLMLEFVQRMLASLPGLRERAPR